MDMKNKMCTDKKIIIWFIISFPAGKKGSAKKISLSIFAATQKREPTEYSNPKSTQNSKHYNVINFTIACRSFFFLVHICRTKGLNNRFDWMTDDKER